ncbi:MAG: hypothetical protein ACYTG0_03210 [Planctomycetota bacterium]
MCKLASRASSFDETDLPGVYRLALAGRRRPFAVNVPPDESKTAPREPGELEELGVRLGRGPTREDLVAKHRQMRNVELEKRQKMWRWLVAGVLGVLIAETWLAGRLSRLPVGPSEESR